MLAFTTLPPLPTGTPAQPQVEGPQAWLSSLKGKLVKLFRFAVSASMPSPGVSLRPRQGPQAPGSGSSPFPESTHQTQGHAHRLCSLPTPGAPQKPRTGPLLTTVLLIRPIPAVVRAVALAPDPQADAVVLAAEGPVWRAHEPGCSGERTESESALGVPHPGWGPPGSRRAPPRPPLPAVWSPAPSCLEPRPTPPRPSPPRLEPCPAPPTLSGAPPHPALPRLKPRPATPTPSEAPPPRPAPPGPTGSLTALLWVLV